MNFVEEVFRAGLLKVMGRSTKTLQYTAHSDARAFGAGK